MASKLLKLPAEFKKCKKMKQYLTSQYEIGLSILRMMMLFLKQNLQLNKYQLVYDDALKCKVEEYPKNSWQKLTVDHKKRKYFWYILTVFFSSVPKLTIFLFFFLVILYFMIKTLHKFNKERRQVSCFFTTTLFWHIYIYIYIYIQKL